MLHVRVTQSLSFQFGAFTVLVFHTVVFFSLIHSCRGQYQAIGPSQPIVAVVGDDIILPCHLEPAIDASDMTLEWKRPDLEPRFVLVWRDGVELESKKHPSYSGRTSLFINELKLGNISLKLSKVKISDEGRYRCFFPGLGRESTVQLVVGAASSPVIEMTKNSSAVVLQCESKGWYPEPEVLWLDGEGNVLSAGPTETVRDPDDLYTVSSRVTVEKRHNNNFTCRVQQKNTNQTRETNKQVPDGFFPDPSSSTSSATIIGLVVGIIFSLGALFVVWKWRQNKIRKKKHHEDEEIQKVREKKSNSTSNNSEQEPLMDREPDREQLTAGRETLNDLEKEEKTLKTKTRGEFEKRVSRLEGQRKQKEEQVKQLKLQLEEAEQQIEETQRKIHSVNMEEDERETIEEEKDEAVKLLLYTMNDLQRKKAELQKQLQKTETALEGKKKEKKIMAERKDKSAQGKEETLNTLKETEVQRNKKLQDISTGPLRSTKDGHREENIQEVAENEDLRGETKDQAEQQQEEIRQQLSTVSREKRENHSDSEDSL